MMFYYKKALDIKSDRKETQLKLLINPNHSDNIGSVEVTINDGVIERKDFYDKHEKFIYTEHFYDNGNISSRSTYEGIPEYELKPPPLHRALLCIEGRKAFGFCQDFYRNGELTMEVPLQGKKYHGAYRTYHENGQPWALEYYFRNRVHGPAFGWYDNGQLDYRGQYKDGKQWGIWEFFHETGGLWYTGEHQGEDISVGEWREYDEKGNLQSIKNYNGEGCPDGVFFDFDTKGNIRSLKIYDDNKLVKEIGI